MFDKLYLQGVSFNSEPFPLRNNNRLCNDVVMDTIIHENECKNKSDSIRLLNLKLLLWISRYRWYNKHIIALVTDLYVYMSKFENLTTN